MANVKEVFITGTMEYDAGENEELLEFLGVMNTPSFGIRIAYGGVALMMPNSYGGRTAMYDYTVSGEEAVRDEWIKKLVSLLESVGTVSIAKYRDIENNTPWYNLLK